MTTQQRIMRVYVDTSVFGGVSDAEYARESAHFFQLIRQGRLGLVTSALVEDEIMRAPEAVQALFDEMGY